MVTMLQSETAVVTAQGGSAIIFDGAGLLAAPIAYTWQINDSYVTDFTLLPILALSGTPSAHVLVMSTVGGGDGSFTNGGNYGGGAVHAQYTDFVRIGDANQPALAPNYTFRDWNLLALDNCRFMECGAVTTDGLTDGSAADHHQLPVPATRPPASPSRRCLAMRVHPRAQ